MSFLDALDESPESTAVPRIGAFQPKVKPRGKKPNVAAKSKVTAVDKKHAKQQPAKVAPPETNPSMKENPLSPAQDTVERQIIFSTPFPGSPVDVKPDVAASSISTEMDSVEEKPLSETLVPISLGRQTVSSLTLEEAPYSVEYLLGMHSSPSGATLQDETPVSVQETEGAEIVANGMPSVSIPIEENLVSVPSVKEPVGFSPQASQPGEKNPLIAPLVEEIMSTEVITASSSAIVEAPFSILPKLESSIQELASSERIPLQGPDVEDASVSISSELEPLVHKAVSTGPITSQISVVEEVLHSNASELEPLFTQKISSSRLSIENPAEEVQVLDDCSQDPTVTRGLPLSSSQTKRPQSKKPSAVLAEAASGVTDQENDEAFAIHDVPDESSSPVSCAYGHQSVGISEHEKQQAKLQRTKRKRKEVGESTEGSWETKVSISSNKLCKVTDQQPQNGASERSTKLQDTNELRTVVLDSPEMPGKITENGENYSLLNAGDIEKETDSRNNQEEKYNNNSGCRREKMPARKPSNDVITVQGIISDDRENVAALNINLPLEGAAPINDLYGKINDQRRSWRQKLKQRNAVDSSEMMPIETSKERENILVTNTNSLPDKDVALEISSDDTPNNQSKYEEMKMKARKVADGSGILQREILVENPLNELTKENDPVDQHKKKLKRQTRKNKDKKVVHDSIEISQEILETDNCFYPNAERPSASVELAKGNDQDDQENDKSKQQRPELRGKKAACGSKKLIQESPTETLAPSNVETRENCLVSNVGVELDDLSEKNNSQSRRRKRKSTPLTNHLDTNNINTDLANIKQSSEDQELNEDVTEKQTSKKRKASTNGKSLESTKVKFSHSTVRRRRRVEQHLLDTPEADLDTSKMTLRDLIRLAEAKERKQKKEELTKNKLQSVEAASNSNANKPTKEPEEDEGDILAPQVKVVNGQIVINEESLVVSHRDLNTDDFRTYRRVEESTSKLNYHTYMNRTPAERWSKSDTELFYKAMQQFGTDFAMIMQLFPGRTRRQVKAKFKTEERKNPLQLADTLLHRTQDHSHFEMLIDRLKISSVPAENGNPDCKKSPSVGLEDITLETPDEAHEERGNNTQNNSTLDISETQEVDQCEKRPVKERDSTFPVGSSEDISNIDEINESYKHMEDSSVGKEASPSKENTSSEPSAKPPKSLFSYQVGSTKPKSLFGYQL